MTPGQLKEWRNEDRFRRARQRHIEIEDRIRREEAMDAVTWTMTFTGDSGMSSTLTLKGRNPR